MLENKKKHPNGFTYQVSMRFPSAAAEAGKNTHTYIQLLYMSSGRNARLNSEFHISFCCCAVLFVYTEIIVYVVDIGRNDVKKLFEFWCEVQPTRGIDRGSISRNGGGTATPAGVIIESFPEGFRDKEVLTGIPSFAFPCDLER